MMVINDKYNCCGCGACYQVCPQSCISMKYDDEGFFYPHTNTDLCTNCSLCELTCPTKNDVCNIHPQDTFVSYSLIDNIRQKGSSGGLFQTIAEYVIRSGGIVFGARFDQNWNIIHDYTDTIKGITAFCGSKYLQSNTGNSYKQSKSFLDKGKMVLYSGTPCQIYGLKKYLRKEYANLITIDFVCHGVPSPKVWQSYLDYSISKKGISRQKIAHISFRDKCTGWKRYSLTIKDDQGTKASTPFKKSSYMQLFLRNFILRPSCYNCRFKNGTNISDITLGDFWGVTDIRPDLDDDKGLSILLVNSPKGMEIVSKQTSIICNPMPLSECIHKNPSYNEAVTEPADRPLFWNEFNQDGFVGAIKFLKKNQPSTFSILKYKIKTIFRSLSHKSAL